jgi:hypothetical protein
MPSVLPEPAGPEEQARLLKVFRMRLADGDRPTVVLHEMLLAGVSPLGLRKILNEAYVAASHTNKTASELTWMGIMVGLLTGRLSAFKSRDKREPKAIEEALADLDRWERRANGSLRSGA